jgi:hypothetical protein
MLYVTCLTIHSHLSQEQRLAGMARRAEWKYPAGVKVVSEYWRSSAPHCITTYETDSYDPILAMQLQWGDFFEFNTSPACTPEQGLAAGQKALKK